MCGRALFGVRLAVDRYDYSASVKLVDHLVHVLRVRAFVVTFSA